MSDPENRLVWRQDGDLWRAYVRGAPQSWAVVMRVTQDGFGAYRRVNFPSRRYKTLASAKAATQRYYNDSVRSWRANRARGALEFMRFP